MTEMFKYDDLNSSITAAADYLKKQLNSNQGQILLLLSGGSSLNPVREAFKDIDDEILSRIHIAQVDGIYTDQEGVTTNWRQIEEALGDKINKVSSLLPILNQGDYPEDIAINYEMELNALLEQADEKIGVYGIGEDGRLAGMLPTKNPEEFTRFVDGRLIVNYQAVDHQRITSTQSLLTRLDEAIVFLAGQNKKHALNQLSDDIAPHLHPAQFLKDVKRVTIFTGDIG